MMEFMYDGSHLIENEVDEEQIFSYTNGVSLWMVFNNKENTRKCLIKLDDEILAEFKRVTEGEAFVQGMMLHAERQGEFFVKMDDKIFNMDQSVLQSELIKLKKENVNLRNEKEKAQALAGKLVKGIMKNNSENAERKIKYILEKYAHEL